MHCDILSIFGNILFCFYIASTINLYKTYIFFLKMLNLLEFYCIYVMICILAPTHLFLIIRHQAEYTYNISSYQNYSEY